MAPVKKEAIVLIMDIRKSETQPSESDIIHAKMKECARKILLRKVISKSKDDIALVVLGSENSSCMVDQNLSYDNIHVVRDLQPPSWGMVEDVITGQETATDFGGDILEALVVAMSIMRKKGTSSYTAQKIVLLSHACGKSNTDGLDLIIGEMKNKEIQVTVIGPNISELSQSQAAEMKFDGNLTEWSVVTRIAVETDGLVCRFEDALEQLTNFEKKKTKSMPWKAGFEIGPDITIPVFGVIKVSPADDIKAKIIRVSGDDGSRAERDYIYTVHSATTADEKPVEKEELIEGYNFGSTIVPFSADEKAVLSYKSGPRSLKLLYFTKAKNVPKHLYVGSGQYYFFPAGGERSQSAFSALVYAMEELNVVAIVRRVYNANNNPTLAAMIPKIRDKYVCFTYVGLPYAGDIKPLSFRPLTTKNSQPSSEQLKAVDDLISSMNLMEVTDEYGEVSEAFRPKSTLDPCQQHLYEVICDRALNPNKKEVSMPSENVRKMLRPPTEIEERMKPVLNRIKALFPLEEKKPKEGARKAAADVFKQEADFKAEDVPEEEEKANVKPSTIQNIGTLTPVSDFNRMLEEKQIPFKEVCCQMQDMIWNIVELAFDLDDMRKAVVIVKALRDACIERDPNIFNSWITKLKNDLPLPKMSFLKLLVEENVALITCEESKLSSVTREEVDVLVRSEAAEPEEGPTRNEDLDDLLNDM